MPPTSNKIGRPITVSIFIADNCPISQTVRVVDIRPRCTEHRGRRYFAPVRYTQAAFAEYFRNTAWMNKLFLTFCLLAFATIANASEPAARTIYLVRHGQYVSDPAINEKIGPGISPIGSAQAHMAGARLAGLQIKFDSFYVSPMQRARDTAAIIGQNFPGSKFEVIDDLAECTPPTRDKKIMAAEKPEDMAACTAALNRVFAKYFKPSQDGVRSELFICHGNVIRSLVVRSLGVDPDSWLSMSVGHASITKIRIEADGRFKVIAVGDAGHLPPNLLTGASGDPERSLAIPALK